MSDDYMFDELYSIEKKIDKLCNLIEEQNRIALSNNQLLRKLVNSRKTDSEEFSSFNNNADMYAKDNLLIVHESIEKSYDYVRDIAITKDVKIEDFRHGNKGEFTAKIMSLEENDFLFIDIRNPCFDAELFELLKECIETNSFEFTIGAGSDARVIRIDIFPLRYVIYTDTEEIIPKEMKPLFTKVK